MRGVICSANLCGLWPWLRQLAKLLTAFVPGVLEVASNGTFCAGKTPFSSVEERVHEDRLRRTTRVRNRVSRSIPLHLIHHSPTGENQRVDIRKLLTLIRTIVPLPGRRHMLFSRGVDICFSG